MAEYILVIHGTFNAPEDGQLNSAPEKGKLVTASEKRKRNWFQLDPDDSENFCNRLNKALATGPLYDAVWRKCPGAKVEEFRWSGGNTHEAREDGAEKLCELLFNMRRSDPEANIHLIAHSHGGNVVLKAIELYFKRLKTQAQDIARRVEWRPPGTADADAIDAVLKQICGEAVAKSAKFRGFADKLILPIVGKQIDRFGVIRFGFVKWFLRPWVKDVIAEWNESAQTERRLLWRAWSRSYQSHRLGKVVFLGTPFYHKRRVRVANFIADYIFYLIWYGWALYFATLFWAGILSLLPWIDFVGFKPWGWPVWLIVVVGGLLFYSLLLIPEEIKRYNAALWAKIDLTQNANLYFQEYTTSAHASELKWDDHVQPLDAFVLSAGLLDEALMGLSIEPLVFGFLSPQLTKRLTPSFLPPAPPSISARYYFAWPPGKRAIQWIFHYAAALLTAVLVRASRRWTAPRLREVILDIACAAGFGLPPKEFSNAVVTSKKELEVPSVFDAGKVWDVTELFATTRLPTLPAATAVLLDFLWDKNALEKALKESEKKLKESSPWVRVKDYLPQLKARAGRYDDEFESEIKRLCAILEIRMREFAGIVELHHSRYYADERIIQAIAQFLEKGTRPDEPVSKSSSAS